MMDNDETELERHCVNKDVHYSRKAKLTVAGRNGIFLFFAALALRIKHFNAVVLIL